MRGDGLPSAAQLQQQNPKNLGMEWKLKNCTSLTVWFVLHARYHLIINTSTDCNQTSTIVAMTISWRDNDVPSPLKLAMNSSTVATSVENGPIQFKAPSEMSISLFNFFLIFIRPPFCLSRDEKRRRHRRRRRRRRLPTWFCNWTAVLLIFFRRIHSN